MIAYAFYKQLRRAIDKDDTRAFWLIFNRLKVHLKTRLIGENGKIVNPTIVFSKSEDDILKELGT